MKRPRRERFDFNDDTCLWGLRRDAGIADDDVDGWKKLALGLARELHPDLFQSTFLTNPYTTLFPQEVGKPGRKKKWDFDEKLRLIDEIDDLKRQSPNPTETDQSIIQRHGLAKKYRVGTGTLIKQVSISRQLLKNKEKKR